MFKNLDLSAVLSSSNVTKTQQIIKRADYDTTHGVIPDGFDRFLVDKIIRPHNKKGPWIAGGAPLQWLKKQSSAGRDIDVFCQSAEQFDQLRTQISKFNSSSVHTSENAATYKIFGDGIDARVVQLIRKKFFNSLEEVFAHFDLSVCMVGYDSYNELLLAGHEHTMRDIKEARINFVNLRDDSLRRLIKYSAYGYRADEAEYARVVANTDVSNAKETWTQTGDYDAAF